ncbi:hypothetical protein OE88DRAFT_1666014 [Heliocybe sulcata]|uniref:Auxin efflux carrier n=1 Tax=Heliocybe sulcata TaxID=5364 RepID=A0A5C3MPU2_9AGAM|nr:hypothetical protein OE88DRAFT_1666014 [Heliocybe sulcata]
MQRARSMILLNSAVQHTLTFAFGPPILKQDRPPKPRFPDTLIPHARREPQSPSSPSSLDGTPPTIQDREHVGLLRENDDDLEDGVEEVLAPLTEVPDWGKWYVLRRPLQWVNPPLVGAGMALVLGITPPLHHLLLDEDGALNKTLTQAIGNLGSLFVGLQMFLLGANLQLLPTSTTSSSSQRFAKSTISTLIIRYLIMPALSILFVWSTARRNLFITDPLTHFILILIPSGPSAMMMISLAEMVGVDVGDVAKFLCISYAVSPLIAVVSSVGLGVVNGVDGRRS